MLIHNIMEIWTIQNINLVCKSLNKGEVHRTKEGGVFVYEWVTHSQ